MTLPRQDGRPLDSLQLHAVEEGRETGVELAANDDLCIPRLLTAPLSMWARAWRIGR